jgi:hypothetical protein
MKMRLIELNDSHLLLENTLGFLITKFIEPLVFICVIFIAKSINGLQRISRFSMLFTSYTLTRRRVCKSSFIASLCGDVDGDKVCCVLVDDGVVIDAVFCCCCEWGGDEGDVVRVAGA